MQSLNVLGHINLVIERVVGYQFSPQKSCDINLVLKRLKFISS